MDKVNPDTWMMELPRLRSYEGRATVSLECARMLNGNVKLFHDAVGVCTLTTRPMTV